MDEARRFLRYVTPGLLYVGETAILLALILPTWTLPQLQALKRETGLALILAAVLASGGAGFLFSTIHHALHWMPWGKDGSFLFVPPIAHTGVVEWLRQKGMVCVYQIRAGQRARERFPETVTLLPEERLAPQSAWLVQQVLWFARLRDAESSIAAAEPRSVALHDLAHSLGTARIASVVAALTAFLNPLFLRAEWSGDFGDILRYVSALVLAALVLLVQHENYRRACRNAEAFVDGVLTEALVREGVTPDSPAAVYVEGRFGAVSAKAAADALPRGASAGTTGEVVSSPRRS
jgi:hypothetical protein